MKIFFSSIAVLGLLLLAQFAAAVPEADGQRIDHNAVENERRRMDESQNYLEENAKRDGVVVTDSGVQYEILEPGSGSTPSLEDTVEITFKAIDLDGTDSDYPGFTERFKVSQAGNELQQVLQQVGVGGIWTIYTPAELAHGEIQIHRFELIAVK
ncbi:hypothetical protein HW452_08650 [Halomonas aquamarina]|uniref:Uncharacterized protein n=1 Tax=Vreelandella aquamarina TaxID=77097 RepID=A0ACC5VV50_9GAMM|nr:FKBP-type peptidyl-prolyl cis-trans isomerase N-terminal domain-containing protein [Halomonas aquamarina]MBZ5487594.1 hypothetical protein [Halomonas aquamarina]